MKSTGRTWAERPGTLPPFVSLNRLCHHPTPLDFHTRLTFTPLLSPSSFVSQGYDNPASSKLDFKLHLLVNSMAHFDAHHHVHRHYHRGQDASVVRSI